MAARRFTLIFALLGASALLATFAPDATAQQAAYIPVVVNDPAVGDPYAAAAAPSLWQRGTIAQAGGNWILGGNPGTIGTSSLLLNQTTFFPTGTSDTSRLWLSGEYLLWDTDGMDTPALVTTSPNSTPQNQAAYLGLPTTTILFGASELNDGAVSGFRVGAGYWITAQKTFAIEGEYFRLGEHDDRYSGSSDGSTILGRPFFDILAGQETAQLISYPGLVQGDVGVDTSSNLQSAMLVGRAALCPAHGGSCNCQRSDRIDWIVGYRHIELKDSIFIGENLTSLLSSAPGTVSLADQFTTSNRFNGLQLGIVHRANFQRAWLESMLRVAVGANQQRVRIAGSTSITETGVTDTFNGGLLAQRSNIGQWERDEFVMVPEIGVKLGLRVTKRLHATVGYTALYLPNVVRAGNQIDSDVNPNLVAPEVDPFTGALRPRFQFVESDYWAHGLTLGGELRF